MSFAGSLQTMPLADILQWVASGAKTGTLDVERLLVKKTIGFEAGTITSSWSNDPRESLGQYLVREGKVTEEQLFQALLRQEKEGLVGSVPITMFSATVKTGTSWKCW